jgi:hypothetical protein
MTTAEFVHALVRECARLEPALPKDDRVRNDIAAILRAVEAYERGQEVDAKALDECIRRLRIAATTGRYRDILPS